MTSSVGAAVAGVLAIGVVGVLSGPAAALPIPAAIAGTAEDAVVPVSSWGQRVHGYGHGYGGYGYGYRHPHRFGGYGGYGRPFGYGYRRHFHPRYYGGY